MSGKGNCYHNSAVESFFKSLKAEIVWRRNRQTRREVEIALLEYISGFYNPRRPLVARYRSHILGAEVICREPAEPKPGRIGTEF